MYDFNTTTGVVLGEITKQSYIEYYIWDYDANCSVMNTNFKLINYRDHTKDYFIGLSKDHPDYLNLVKKCLQLNIDHSEYLDTIMSYCNG